MQIVHVEWLDSRSMHGWQPKEAVNEFEMDQMQCSTVGYKIHESESFIVVALSISETSYQDMLAIPKCSIISQAVLNGDEFRP